ncbi:MAG: LacI family DNA-binding transcriptional regulator [Oscillospiraceae bacterium]|nr:LacI family DNA-binding transcriptional regulator [Oscillospiraceae bacterium]
MVSIKDIAEECGVSAATVSKALNNHDDVSTATKERIQETAKRLGYLPNSMARALKTKKTYNIGVLMVDQAHSGLKHHYFASILDSFKVMMERNGYDLTFISSQIGEKTCTYREHCLYRNVDGVLAACVDFNAPDVQSLMDSSLPLVSIDHISEGNVTVASDNADGIRQAVRFAAEHGHSRISYIYGDDTQVTHIRHKAFCDALSAYHCENDLSLQLAAKYLHPELAYDLTMDLLRREDRPTCILYPDDVCAISGITAIRASGMEVGRDVSVIGYDGTPLLQMLRPKLTTIAQDTEGIGQKAADLMLRLLRKDTIPSGERIQYCKGTLLEGGTVGTPV